MLSGENSQPTYATIQSEASAPADYVNDTKPAGYGKTQPSVPPPAASP